MKATEYLYHYTTLDTARLILENKTIRFNNLNKTDDIDESLTSDVGIAGKYVFVSCWTDDPQENITLWSMYSDGFNGVRIKMKYDPFMDMIPSLLKELPPEQIITDDKEDTTISKEPFRQVIPWIHMFNGRYTCLAPFTNQDNGYKSCVVKYTDDEKLLKPKVLLLNGTKINYDIGKVGVYKRKEWEYQKEIRYRINAFPMRLYDFINGNKKGNEVVLDGINSMILNEDLPINFIDLFIDEVAFKSMEIMLGPMVSNREIEDFTKFVYEKNPYCTITKSKLHIRYRKK